MQVETPFPAEGTITPTDYGYSASLPCASEYMTETEDGTDYLQAAVDRAARKFGEGVEVRVRFTSDHSGMGCGATNSSVRLKTTTDPDWRIPEVRFFGGACGTMQNQQFTALFQALADGYDLVAEDIAAAQRKHFEALVDQGFTEEQAMELIKNFEMNGDA